MSMRFAAVVSLGVFLGMLFFGLITTVENYNNVVSSDKQLKLVSVSSDEKTIFMNEEINMTVPSPGILKQKLVKFKEQQLVPLISGCIRLTGRTCDYIEGFLEEYKNR